jgi:hypothetical protein
MPEDALSQPSPPADAVTVPSNRDPLWRFIALGVLLLLPAVFLLSDGDATTDDLVIVALALLLSVIPWFGVAMLLTMRIEVTPGALALPSLTIHDRTVARADLNRIRAERRATLSRGALFASPHLHVTLPGRTRDGEVVDLLLNGMMLDLDHLLRALAPWIEADPALVQDDETRGTGPARPVARDCPVTVLLFPA